MHFEARCEDSQGSDPIDHLRGSIVDGLPHDGVLIVVAQVIELLLTCHHAGVKIADAGPYNL